AASAVDRDPVVIGPRLLGDVDRQPVRRTVITDQRGQRADPDEEIFSLATAGASQGYGHRVSFLVIEIGSSQFARTTGPIRRPGGGRSGAVARLDRVGNE